jgi:hypothetical protein
VLTCCGACVCLTTMAVRICAAERR